MTIDELLKSDVSKMYDIEQNDNALNIHEPNHIGIILNDGISILDNGSYINIRSSSFILSLWKNIKMTQIITF